MLSACFTCTPLNSWGLLRKIKVSLKLSYMNHHISCCKPFNDPIMEVKQASSHFGLNLDTICFHTYLA